ncbi:uncharacterized protein si:zfos-905g2.1 [Megalops cyprinoides]|uniref:uncharacterized protein si:zfos-905g2.1 n=1 Tax=Megalops cyprinoides TaxID=118141 RepID=UPI001863EC83|nr:uncharacterized protein si:zfos-905g2.1 [Megalops cyprinoides]
MKPDFSPGNGKSLSESTTKPAPSEYTGHEEDVDLPFVIVKLEDEESTTQSDSDEWMRPVESTEEAEDDQNDTDDTEISEEITHHSDGVFLRDHGPGEQTLDKDGYQEHARVRKKRLSLRIKCVQRQARRQKTKSMLNGRGKRPVGKKCKKPFSKIQGFAKLAFMESQRRETPTKKPTEKEFLVSSLNTEELEESTMETDYSHAADKHPSQISDVHHPSAGSQGCWKQGVDLPVTSVSAPYNRLKSDQVISPQQATEPPLFVTKDGAENAKCNEKQEGVLSEVLNYCKFMWTSIQRLEQKVDSLQSNLSSMQALQMSLQHPFKESASQRPPPSTTSYSPWAVTPPPITLRFTRSRLEPGRGPSHGLAQEDRPSFFYHHYVPPSIRRPPFLLSRNTAGCPRDPPQCHLQARAVGRGRESVMGKDTKASAEDQQLGK